MFSILSGMYLAHGSLEQVELVPFEDNNIHKYTPIL